MHRRTFLSSASATVGAMLAGCRRPVPVVRPQRPWSAQIPPSFLFATGIENSYPRLPDGSRHDQLEQGGHYDRWRDDFALAQSLGIDAIRYGPAWYRVHTAPGRFDWSVADDQMEWLRRSGLVVIADLCHFGVPDWIDGFRDPALRVHLAEYAREFARRYPWVQHFTPINEMFVAANFSSMLGWWNECATGVESFARALANVSMAHELAVEAIMGEQPRAVIVQTESFERFTPADDSPGAHARSRFWNEARFATLDLTLGRLPSHPVRDLFLAAGMTTSDFAFLREPRAVGRRWIGIDYYVTSEQVVDANDRKRPAQSRVGLATLGVEYHDRYRLPLIISETSRVASHGPAWLAAQWSDAVTLSACAPLMGFTWFPLGDVVDWRHALRERRGDVDPIGLYDHNRRPHATAVAYRELIASARGSVGTVAIAGAASM